VAVDAAGNGRKKLSDRFERWNRVVRALDDVGEKDDVNQKQDGRRQQMGTAEKYNRPEKCKS